jgi:hypothetical protein
VNQDRVDPHCRVHHRGVDPQAPTPFENEFHPVAAATRLDVAKISVFSALSLAG